MALGCSQGSKRAHSYLGALSRLGFLSFVASYLALWTHFMQNTGVSLGLVDRLTQTGERPASLTLEAPFTSIGGVVRSFLLDLVGWQKLVH